MCSRRKYQGYLPIEKLSSLLTWYRVCGSISYGSNGTGGTQESDRGVVGEVVHST